MIDISTKQNLQNYLIDKKLCQQGDDCVIHYCKGGVSCTVAYVCVNDKPMIIKQALGQLKTKDVWLCDQNRMEIEYESNRIYYELMPEYAPETYFYDHDNYIYGREAVPDGCLMWKDYLMSGILSYPVATQAIDTLVTVHNKCSGDAEIAERFANKSVFHDLRISPYFQFTAQKHPEFQALADELSGIMMESEISLIHGDYSPKNIMIVDNCVKVLDYEVACYGHPAFDLGFFSNHFILKAVKFDAYAMGYLQMLLYMVNRYLTQMSFMDRAAFEKVYSKSLAMFLLARIDGKSPVEYLVGNQEKQDLVRAMSYELLRSEITTFAEAFAIIQKNIVN